MTCAKCGSGLVKGLCHICGHNKNSLNNPSSISETSSQSPPNINHCCYECGDPLDGIFCKRSTCKSCGKDAYIGYNCPSKVLVIYNPEPCNNHTIAELPQALPIFHLTFHSEVESPFTLDSTPTYVDESPNVFHPPPQPSAYPCEFCGNDAYYDVPQQYTCYDDCGVTHDAYQCQPMNEVYSYGQNSCYDSTSIGFDQSEPQQYTVNHPIFNAYNSCLDSRIQLNSTLVNIHDQMTSITSLCELACQVVQKKLEEKQLEEERAAKANNRKPPVCCDDDDDGEISKSLKDNIISELPPYEFIKSGVEDLILIPSESEGISDHMCDVPFLDNSPPLDVSKDTIEDLFESNEEFSSTDDDSFSFDDIDYVEASPPDSELVSSEVPFDAKCESDSNNDLSCSDEDVLEKIEDIRLIEKLLYDNSSPRLLEEFVSANSDAAIESFSPSPILDYDSERDILIRKDLPSNNSLSFAEN
nr:hypothetical protein [Tanacetum cinerariifolium]